MDIARETDFKKTGYQTWKSLDWSQSVLQIQLLVSKWSVFNKKCKHYNGFSDKTTYMYLRMCKSLYLSKFIAIFVTEYVSSKEEKATLGHD